MMSGANTDGLTWPDVLLAARKNGWRVQPLHERPGRPPKRVTHDGHGAASWEADRDRRQTAVAVGFALVCN